MMPPKPLLSSGGNELEYVSIAQILHPHGRSRENSTDGEELENDGGESDSIKHDTRNAHAAGLLCFALKDGVHNTQNKPNKNGNQGEEAHTGNKRAYERDYADNH